MGCGSSIASAVGTAVTVGEKVQDLAPLAAAAVHTAGKVQAVDDKEKRKKEEQDQQAGAAGEAPKPADGAGEGAAGGATPQPVAAVENSAGDPAPNAEDPAWISKTTKQKMKIVLKATLKATPDILTELSKYVPAPGDKALLLLGDLAGATYEAVSNTEDIADLAERAASVMDVILERQANLDDPDAPLGPKYKKLMSSLCEVLKKIKAFGEKYASRLFVMRVLTRKQDKSSYSDLVEELAFIMVDATFALALDTNNMTAEMKDMMKEIKAGMRSEPPPSHVPELVESLGGVQAVLADDAKLQQVVAELGGDQALGVQATANLTRIVQSGFKAVDAKMNRGPHSVIGNEDMALMWRDVVAMSFRLEWEDFWSIFPSTLRSIVQKEHDVDELVRLLSPAEAKARFKARVNAQGEEGSISVVEVDMAFPKGARVLEAVQTILGGKDVLSGVAGRNLLPGVSATSAARELKAAALVRAVQGALQQEGPGAGAAGGVCVVGDSAMNKTSLAIAAGQRLWTSNVTPGGAVLVDLRECPALDGVLTSLCVELHINMDLASASASANTAGLAAAVTTLLSNVRAACGGPMLLVLAHAHSSPDIQDLITQLAAEAVVIATCHQPLGAPQLVQFNVGKLLEEESTSLALAVGGSSGLSREEAAQVVKLAGGVPLLVQLLTQELQEGRLNAQAIEQAVGQAAADGERTAAVLASSLGALPSERLQDLALLLAFPSSFSVDDAAAVLGCDAAQAHARLAALENKTLLGMGSAEGRSIHLDAAVAAAVVAAAPAAARADGAARFASYTFGQLREWAALYRTPAGLAVLRNARAYVADVAAALGRAAEASPSERAAAVAGVDAVELAELLQPLGALQLPACGALWGQLSAGEGVEAEDKAAALYMLARVQAAQFRPEEALASVEAVVLLGAETKAALHAAMFKAFLLNKLGRPADGEAACAAALELCTRVLGAESVAAILCGWVLAECLAAQGKLEAAEAQLRQALPLLVTALGAQHPLTASVRGALVACLQSQGRADEAAALSK